MRVILCILVLACSLNASEVEEAVARFYSDRALDVRTTDDHRTVQSFLVSLTPSFRSTITNAQRTVEAWRSAAKMHPEFFKDLKPPPNEGTLFTSVYEGGEFTKIVSTQISADRAYVTVSICGKPLFSDQTWTDIIILHRIESVWLIDDILSGAESGQPTSIRANLNYPEPPKPNKAVEATR